MAAPSILRSIPMGPWPRALPRNPEPEAETRSVPPLLSVAGRGRLARSHPPSNGSCWRLRSQTPASPETGTGLLPTIITALRSENVYSHHPFHGTLDSRYASSVPSHIVPRLLAQFSDQSSSRFCVEVRQPERRPTRAGGDLDLEGGQTRALLEWGDGVTPRLEASAGRDHGRACQAPESENEPVDVEVVARCPITQEAVQGSREREEQDDEAQREEKDREGRRDQQQRQRSPEGVAPSRSERQGFEAVERGVEPGRRDPQKLSYLSARK